MVGVETGDNPEATTGHTRQHTPRELALKGAKKERQKYGC
jgi:hypothetical protein